MCVFVFMWGTVNTVAHIRQWTAGTLPPLSLSLVPFRGWARGEQAKWAGGRLKNKLDCTVGDVSCIAAVVQLSGGRWEHPPPIHCNADGSQGYACVAALIDEIIEDAGAVGFGYVWPYCIIGQRSFSCQQYDAWLLCFLHLYSTVYGHWLIVISGDYWGVGQCYAGRVTLIVKRLPAHLQPSLFGCNKHVSLCRIYISHCIQQVPCKVS